MESIKIIKEIINICNENKDDNYICFMCSDCVFFSIILKILVEKGDIVVNSSLNHVALKVDGICYDVTGRSNDTYFDMSIEDTIAIQYFMLSTDKNEVDRKEKKYRELLNKVILKYHPERELFEENLLDFFWNQYKTKSL